MRRLTGSEREFYRQFSRHGQGDTLVEITPQEVALLVAITHLDLHDDVPEWLSQDLYWVASKPFFEIGPNEIAELDPRTDFMALDIMRKAGIGDLSSPDYLYLANLATLYRRPPNTFGFSSNSLSQRLIKLGRAVCLNTDTANQGCYLHGCLGGNSRLISTTAAPKRRVTCLNRSWRHAWAACRWTRETP